MKKEINPVVVLIVIVVILIGVGLFMYRKTDTSFSKEEVRDKGMENLIGTPSGTKK